MCGRYNFSKESSSEMVQAVLENLQSRQIEVKTGEVFPGDVAAVIASNRKLEPQAFGMKWGYQLPDGKLIFNARSETAAQKAMFADGMRQRRCLVPADSYYEWQKTGQGKQKYEIAPSCLDGFFLAGIYRMEQGRPVFSILTKDPVESIAFIHNRMPVILPNDAMQDWLNPRYNGIEILQASIQDMRFSAC
jgi:putative SOS response-associated peptidase YedK